MKLTIAKDELQFGHKQTLNKDFWKDEKLDTEVRLAIMAIVKNFLKTTNLEMTADEIDEIEFTGSLANYNYSKYSDVDIHLLFDFSKIGDDPEFMRDYLTTKAINWNNRHNVTIFGHEVELYITDAGSDHHSTGVYSVKDDKWLVKPVRDTKLSAELNLNKVKDKADKISKEIDMLVSVEGDLSLETIEGLKNKIKKMRVAGLETGGEFSIENLAFKLLRRRGELSTLYALMNQAQDAELSLDEDVEWWKKRRKLDNKNYLELIGHVRGAKKNKSGTPYILEPHKKLPMSAPPGVAESILKEYTDEEEEKFEQIKQKIDGGATFELDLKSRSFGQFKCLTQHTYEVKKEGQNYRFKLKSNIEDVLTPIAKKLKDVGRIDPNSRCVYHNGDKLLNLDNLKQIILSELQQRNVLGEFGIVGKPVPPQIEPSPMPPIPLEPKETPKEPSLEPEDSKVDDVEVQDDKEKIVKIQVAPVRTITVKCDKNSLAKLKGGNTPKSIAYIVCKQGLDYSINKKRKSRRNVTIDQDWKTKNLIRVKLGDKTVRFNKQFAKKLQDAYQEAITESGLEDFGFKPVAYTARRIGSKPTDPLSTHALGIGIDFYVPAKTFSNKLAYWKETQFAMGMGNRDYDDIAKENKLEVTEEMKEKILNFREKYKKFVAAMKRNGFRAGADFTRDSKFGDPSHFEVSIEKLLN
tara:strand:+ start:370 stop:2445 length:2076 start_codon:yes stop_codon:yes gene_type:complete